MRATPCSMCRDFFAGYSTMSAEEKEFNVQRSCRHRSANPVRPNSPKVCWELEIPEDDEPVFIQDKPFNTLARRRELRALAKQKSNE